MYRTVYEENHETLLGNEWGLILPFVKICYKT